MSTERGAVHAVALADGEKLPERVLLQRVVKTRGDSKADLAVAVQTAMDTLAAELESEREIVGAAVTYRDAAERRAIVTKLASGRWHTASLVSTKAAHLSVAGIMTWLDEFDDLLICEVVAGHQAFTLVDRKRSRVLAATSQTGGASAEALDEAVSNAWDQFEAAMVRPDAVVLIGSAVDSAVVETAIDGFGAPVLPCKIATFASAVGAALFAMSDATGVSEPDETDEPVRSARGHTALFAAASVLAGGLLAGGMYATVRSTGAVVADARVTADARVVDGKTGSVSGSTAGSSVQPDINPFDRPEVRQPTSAGSTVDSTLAGLELDNLPQYNERWGALPPVLMSPDAHEFGNEAAGSPQQLPGTGIPGPTTKIGAPNEAMLFPGEAPPPAAFTPEFYRWWDNHVRLLMQWVAQQLQPT
ncbi:hypothetical protein ACW2Q0_10410 [Nocardia sp. R16R-3T]